MEQKIIPFSPKRLFKSGSYRYTESITNLRPPRQTSSVRPQRNTAIFLKSVQQFWIYFIQTVILWLLLGAELIGRWLENQVFYSESFAHSGQPFLSKS